MTDQPAAERGPILIIGSARSGTTMLRLILDSHPRISCGEETHLLQTMEPALGKHWRLLDRYGFPREYWTSRLADFYGGAMSDYAARRGKARWADKDPSNTLLLPFAGELFPDAQYIHLIRDGHDVVASHKDRWGYRSGVRAARGAWRKYVETARAFGAGQPEGRYHELRYEALVAEPETQLRALFAFLGEDWDPAVLEFDKAEHDGTERYSRFTAQRRSEGGDGSTIYRSRVGAGKDSLDPVLRTMLHRSSGSLLRELGYLD
ncbi:MAG: sulfotransferase [Candidatus Limnocylindrales bacterium]